MTIAPAVAAWFRENGRDLPWRRPGFTAWGTLVSEVMLQQTPVVRVVPRLEQWLERWPTPADLAASPASEAVRAWDRLGYPRRALALHAAAVAITERHGGVVPEDVPSLLALPGVGDYTARAVAVFAHGHRHPVVDTNVRRVLARAVEGLAEPWAPNARRDLPLMESQLPADEAEARVVSAGVMELGALVCVARSPRCDVCPLLDRCAWVGAGRPEHVGPRLRTQARFEGSDRQVRGLIMAELRASDVPVRAHEVEAVWPDAAQRERALAGLVRDGLVTGTADEGWELPS
ncbi:A/G-specific DNA-adenine glycosylase [Frigoribacterium sp. PhB160]|uniref:A/G-specific adenine glycosylase n=1 Tax=Frigoribacterium sp. PhB160 TaxID=2485192 RepID=UPI000F48FED9|nr:A/G-specific adenine glycosylase [Frigoribacterium sp. PhB160]ROS62084.1 A/G-specific DNA-adenine glycosylase [Frigoribacterium sp. PhB160]